MVIADVILEEWTRLNYLMVVYREKMKGSYTREQEEKYKNLLNTTADKIIELQDYVDLAKRDKERMNG